VHKCKSKRRLAGQTGKGAHVKGAGVLDEAGQGAKIGNRGGSKKSAAKKERGHGKKKKRQGLAGGWV